MEQLPLRRQPTAKTTPVNSKSDLNRVIETQAQRRAGAHAKTQVQTPRLVATFKVGVDGETQEAADDLLQLSRTSAQISARAEEIVSEKVLKISLGLTTVGAGSNKKQAACATVVQAFGSDPQYQGLLNEGPSIQEIDLAIHARLKEAGIRRKNDQLFRVDCYRSGKSQNKSMTQVSSDKDLIWTKLDGQDRSMMHVAVLVLSGRSSGRGWDPTGDGDGFDGADSDEGQSYDDLEESVQDKMAKIASFTEAAWKDEGYEANGASISWHAHQIMKTRNDEGEDTAWNKSLRDKKVTWWPSIWAKGVKPPHKLGEVAEITPATSGETAGLGSSQALQAQMQSHLSAMNMMNPMMMMNQMMMNPMMMMQQQPPPSTWGYETPPQLSVDPFASALFNELKITPESGAELIRFLKSLGASELANLKDLDDEDNSKARELVPKLKRNAFDALVERIKESHNAA